ncbi:hypothetical protein NMY22_g3452 [Coprinellus aureogranulatus]|nr:hypothetical protein NMY22_g3452 [Coprinellus aureogranulatus]
MPSHAVSPTAVDAPAFSIPRALHLMTFFGGAHPSWVRQPYIGLTIRPVKDAVADTSLAIYTSRLPGPWRLPHVTDPRLLKIAFSPTTTTSRLLAELPSSTLTSPIVPLFSWYRALRPAPHARTHSLLHSPVPFINHYQSCRVFVSGRHENEEVLFVVKVTIE